MRRAAILSKLLLMLSAGCSAAGTDPFDPGASGAGGSEDHGPVDGSGGSEPGQHPGTGGAVVASGGQSSMTPPPAATYDFNVRFDWPETVPGTAPTCRAGRYSGTFDGGYTATIGIEVIMPVVGDINLVLEESQNGEFFEVSDGELSGLANLTIPFSARIEGRLNCSTLHFEAMLLDGTYDAFGSVGRFEGPLTADYNAQTGALSSGKWDVKEPSDPSRGGDGAWQAQWVP